MVPEFIYKKYSVVNTLQEFKTSNIKTICDVNTVINFSYNIDINLSYNNDFNLSYNNDFNNKNNNHIANNKYLFKNNTNILYIKNCDIELYTDNMLCHLDNVLFHILILCNNCDRITILNDYLKNINFNDAFYTDFEEKMGIDYKSANILVDVYYFSYDVKDKYKKYMANLFRDYDINKFALCLHVNPIKNNYHYIMWFIFEKFKELLHNK